MKIMRRNLFRVMLAMALLCSGMVFAQKKPPRDISHKRHPNLAAAQRLSAQAYQKVVAAQDAHEFDLDGHAQKAKDLLDQANQELKQAAEAANEERK
jgi:F0F1-type ATP synthase membrane subunit b/b'